MPATTPTTHAPMESTTAQGAVIPTRPASDALSVMVTSGLPSLAQVKIMAATEAVAAPTVVVVKICATCAVVPPAAPLKPYQPNHRMKTPSAPSVMEWPLIAFGLLFAEGLTTRNWLRMVERSLLANMPIQ